MVDINLLPWRDYVRREHRKNIIIFYALILSVVVIILGCVQLNLSHQIHAYEQRYAVAVSQLPTRVEKADDIDQHEFMKEKYKHQRILFTVFNQLSYMNNDVSLSKFSRQGKKIIIMGDAETFYEVKKFMSSMLANKNIEFVRLTSLKNQDQHVQFELLVMER